MKGSVSAKTLKGALNSPQSVSGKAVPRGLDGISPVVSVTDIEGGHRVEISDIEGEKTFDVMDGQKGQDGVSATHSWNGTTLVVTSASGTSSADLKGDTGEPGYTPQKGVDYFDGKDGKDGTITFEELTEEQKASLKGEDGKDGTSVTISKITESTDDGGSNVVTFSDGETMTVKNGSRGEQGFSGVYVGDGDMPEGYNVQIIPDGTPDYDPGSGTGESGATFIPSVSEDGIISWTNDKGLTNPAPVDISGKDGYTPKKGVDYFTESEIAEMVSRVISALPVYDGSVTSV